MGLEDELGPIFKALADGQAAQVEALGNRLLDDNPEDRRAILLLLFARAWTSRLTSAPLPGLTLLQAPDGTPLSPSVKNAIYLFRTHLLKQRRLNALNALAEVLLTIAGDHLETLKFITELFNRAGNEQKVDEINCQIDEAFSTECRNSATKGVFDATRMSGIIGETAISFGCLTLLERLDASTFPAPQILVPDDAPVANRCFWDYWQDHLEIVSRAPSGSSPEAQKPWRFCSWRLPDGTIRHHDDVLTYALCRWEHQGNPPLMALKDRHSEACASRALDLGLPEDAWHVCLHVREKGFHDDHTDLVSSDRNADIETYYPAIEEIVSRGGWVVRMGDRAMTPLPPMKGVIDYPFSDVKSDEMDVYLTATARFFLGTASGLFLVPTFFGVPVVITNQTPISQRPYSSRDLFIFKRYRDMQNGKTIPLADACAPPIRGTKNAPFLRGLEVDVIDNTAEEIRAVTAEMLGRLEGKPNLTESEDSLQQRFNQLTGHDFGFPVPRLGSQFIRSIEDLF